jgi:hypothetical protein
VVGIIQAPFQTLEQCRMSPHERAVEESSKNA